MLFSIVTSAIMLTPGIFPPGTDFIIVYMFSPPEFEESETIANNQKLIT